MNLTNATTEELCYYRKQYLEQNFDVDAYRIHQMMSPGEPLFTFEKTPAYIRRPGAAEKVFRLLGSRVKLVAILRDPVTRLYSQYNMMVQRRLLNETFDEMVEHQVTMLRRVGLSSAPLLSEYDQAITAAAFTLNERSFEERRLIVAGRDRIRRLNSLYFGMYAQQLDEWLRYFDMEHQLLVVNYERLQSNRAGVFGEILDFLGIPKVHMDPKAFDKDHNPLTRTTRGQEVVPVEPMSNRTRDYLYDFYRPYNDELADLLGEQWRGMWGPT